ncbi:MAG TPA: hypothetical protein VLF17_07775 [Candidatus Nitrosotenuis sp.]|nr:hypothetical protein [Candidatus Nitrosotenuis sp.]
MSDVSAIKTKGLVLGEKATHVAKISAGYTHSLELKSDGTVLARGSDRYGQLGDDSKLDDKTTPVQVSGLSGIVAVSAGGYHSVALKSDGTVWAWGYDRYGQLGDDATRADKATPVKVSGLSGIVAVSAGGYHSVALKSDGTVWAWGDDYHGQLGDGRKLQYRPTPVQVSGMSDIVAISAGQFHSLALKSDKTVWVWGEDGDGQLGNDATLANKYTAVQVSGLSDIMAVAAGGYHSVALRSDGTVWAWGSDRYGQLGDNAGADKATPVQVSDLSDIMAVSAGYGHSFAIKTDGTVWTRGAFYNQFVNNAPRAAKIIL